jgi:hypothetical protein
MNRHPELEAYLAERRAVLLNEDIEALRSHLIKWGTPNAVTASADVLRVAWHKARTAAMDLPPDERRGSVKWLRNHGYQDWADPDE